MSGIELPVTAIREQMASALHLIIQLQRFPDGTRRIVKVTEVTGMEASTVTLQDIFVFQQEGMDSDGKTIGRYRLDCGLKKVLSQSLIAEPSSLPGFPDGLRPAPDGKSVIIAFYNPAHVSDGLARQMCIETGAVLAEWLIPGSPRVTCPELIQWHGKVMIVFTTAVEGMAAETRAIAPGAGTMYIADTRFTAVPEPPPLVRFV